MNDGAIWIIDDDRDDHELISDIVYELKATNEIVFFKNAKEFLQRLESEKVAPFIVICDVNLPGTDGFELREKMLETPNLKFHSVPFIFWSTYATDQQIEKAYRLRAHGFFIKEGEYNEWKKSYAAIIEYWHKSRMPPKKDEYDEPMTADD